MFSDVEARHTGLRARYAEPHRAYHGQAHVDAMLRGLDDLRGVVADSAAVELAVWYHDAIYDPAAFDNEDRSAGLLRTEMAGLADPALIAKAEGMVRSTARHVLPPDVPEAWRDDWAAFLDLDLAVLGADRDAFAAYERGIAAEYLPVHGEETYRRGRALFLRKLLHEPRLFHTGRAHAALDARARANVRWALGRLG